MSSMRCHGAPCDFITASYDNGNVWCRHCGEHALLTCSCSEPYVTGDCGICHFELDGGGYLNDSDQPRAMHCRHCGRLAWIG